MEASIIPHYAAHPLREPIPFQSSPSSLVQQPELAIEAFQFDPQLANQPDLSLQARQAFGTGSFDSRVHRQTRFQDARPIGPASAPANPEYGPADGASYDLPSGHLPKSRKLDRSRQPYDQLATHTQPFNNTRSHGEVVERFQHESDLPSQPVSGGAKTEGHFSNMKLIPNPPDLERWRQKLFDVDGIINMTEDEFQTYFPHVDNIYSHRSTQKYKRKSFVSHYWDCRLKGRPPGTAKTEDPNKKKRRRLSRKRDQCDVKIKITEFFPDSRPLLPEENAEAPDTATNEIATPIRDQGDDPPRIASRMSIADLTKRHYTIQRVNGNSTNGKTDASAGGHQHTLEESDKIKKNSIYRHFLKEEKERRKLSKTYHKKASGAALNTVKRHSKDHDLKLYGSCFCPFVQRVWIALELKALGYQYVEIDPYQKPQELLDVNPRGLVPALRHGNWGAYESSVLMEYLEDLNTGLPLLPMGNPRMRAHCRLWSDHINRKILPHFYGFLQAQEQTKQTEEAKQLKAEIATIVEAADSTGPFFLGPHISFVDVQFAPWIVRLRKVLTPYRGWPAPEPGTRWAAWVDAIENNEAVKATTSSDELYIDSYERYAENRPNTSQVAKAINEGRGLP